MHVKVGALVGQVQKHVCLASRAFAAYAWQANEQAVACIDALHTSTLPLARLPRISRRCCASSASESSAGQAPSEENMEASTEHKVVGSYTSHTKRLWLERLLREKRGDAGSRLPEPREKAPVLTTVSYPFSTDPVLQEEVRSKLPDLSECVPSAHLLVIRRGELSERVFHSHMKGLWESRTRQDGVPVVLLRCARVPRSTATPGTTCAWASCWRTWTPWPAALRSVTGTVPPLRPAAPELLHAFS
jgi:hypothetical protein